MVKILPLNLVPDALSVCLNWADQEWGESAGFTDADWRAEFQLIEDNAVDQVFVACLDNIPVGMIWMLEHEDVESHKHLTPWISTLVVDPAYRSRGIARALVAHGEAYAALGGVEALYLLTQSPAFYFRLGWEVCDTALLAGNTVFVMQKTLASVPIDVQD